MFNEFKEFAMKGNLVDMAVGFVMGGRVCNGRYPLSSKACSCQRSAQCLAV